MDFLCNAYGINGFNRMSRQYTRWCNSIIVQSPCARSHCSPTIQKVPPVKPRWIWRLRSSFTFAPPKPNTNLEPQAEPPAGSREAAIFGIKTDQTEPAHDWMSSCFSGLSTTTYIKGVPSPIACHMKVTEGFLYLLEEGTCTCGTDNMLLLLLLPLLLPLLLE